MIYYRKSYDNLQLIHTTRWEIFLLFSWVLSDTAKFNAVTFYSCTSVSKWCYKSLCLCSLINFKSCFHGSVTAFHYQRQAPIVFICLVVTSVEKQIWPALIICGSVIFILQKDLLETKYRNCDLKNFLIIQ